jgi:signal transduction histidine kinase
MLKRSTKVLLVVEDNPGDARILREMLKEQGSHGIELIHVECMADAEAHLAAHPVDMILLDLGLPDAQGLGAVRRVRAAAPHLPLVVLTGLDDEALAAQTLHEGAQDYLTKGQIDARGLFRSLRYAVARKAIEDELRQAQKMEAVGQLTGGIAHDFNNLLAVILGNVELARKRVGTDPRVTSLLENAQKAAELGGDLTRRLLAFSRRQTLLPQRVDINLLADDVIKMLQRTLGETIRIEANLQAQPLYAIVDPGQLENALLNLAVNARDAMPDGGTLTIATSQVVLHDADMRTHGGMAPGAYKVITVSDSGTGMTEEVKARVFEPFFTTKEVGKGSGLGLSMVYGFVKQSGGHVTVYSEGGHGTTIRLYLPEPTEDLVSLAQAEPRPSDVIGKGQSVLIVDDNSMVQTILVAMLDDLGFSAIRASDGHQALKELGKDRPIDLMITDVIMPRGMSGIQLAKSTYEKWPRLPIIFISGYSADTAALAEVIGTGGTLLTKPFSCAQLSDAIRSALEGAETRPMPLKPAA